MNQTNQHPETKDIDDFPGYPKYPVDEDIYRNFLEEVELDPEDISRNKELNEKATSRKTSVTDLDIPGAELDDTQEEIGSEDEENNYYSLGGDDHVDLEEKQDDD